MSHQCPATIPFKAIYWLSLGPYLLGFSFLPVREGQSNAFSSSIHSVPPKPLSICLMRLKISRLYQVI
jgi:hypothetical protein